MFISSALIGITILSCLMAAAVLGSMFHARIPGLKHWCSACALLAAVATLLLTVPRTNLLIVALSATVVVVAFLALQGFRVFFHLRAAQYWEYGVLGAIFIGLLVFTYDRPNVAGRVVLMSVVLAYVRLSIFWTVLRYRPKGRPKYGYYFVAIVAVLGAAVHLLRFAVNGSDFSDTATFLGETPLNLAFLTIGALSLPCLAVGMVMLAHDRLAERMEQLATVDDLTGVLGRRAFILYAERAFAMAVSTKTPLSVAVLDVDHFKRINDEYGHAIGDLTLSRVATILAHNVRHRDLLGRIGGEEFALLLPMTDKAVAAQLAEQLRAGMAASMSYGGAGTVPCTVSIGVEEMQGGDSLATLLARADRALYGAKAGGRNCVVVAGGLDVEEPPGRVPKLSTVG